MQIVSEAPGKLFIAGEYAVVEPGQPAVIIAIDRYIRVQLSNCRTECADYASGSIRSSLGGGSQWQWRETAGTVQCSAGTAPHVEAVLQVVNLLRREAGKPAMSFDCSISSGLISSSGAKYGLGSSAAVTVALLQALNEMYDLRLDAIARFRICLLVTLGISPRASGGDIAAACFGGWIAYASPDRAALLAEVRRKGYVAALHATAWETGYIKHLPEPAGANLLVGWTGEPANTDVLVARISAYRETSSYKSFVLESSHLVEELIYSLTTGSQAIFDVISAARSLLQKLGMQAGVEIETRVLANLCDTAEKYGAAAKTSGAGGGDCGIALAPDSAYLPQLVQEWVQNGITHLDLAVHPAAEVNSAEF